jgi:two-component system phosphate regulon sensor histidine kinase PhoR
MIWQITSAALAGALVCTHVSWRRRHEKARADAAAEIDRLNARQKQFTADALAEKEALFNSMVEGVMLLDATGRVRLANRAMSTLFGLREEIIGKTILEALRVHALADLIKRLSVEKQIVGFEITLPGIEARVFEVNATSVPGEDGGGTILVFHDLTRLKKLENTRQEFVANVSHELRTPLSLIKGFVETLIDGAKDNPEVAERFLRTIERNTRRLTLLIDDLLTISRLESGKTLLNLTRLDMRQAADRAIEDLLPKAREKNVQLVNETPAELLARADSDRIQQVFSNLIDNAIKYGRADGTVVVDGRETDDGKIEMSVSDDGPGIPPDSLERIFERFYRVDKARSREQGGTGLGLSIVKHIVQSHGGKAWASSQPGSGSVFCFTLENASRQAAIVTNM